MDERIRAIAAHIRDGRGFIDVGTDHGYLPAALAERGYSGNILASDIGEGPLNAARRTAALAGCSDRIRFLLCDGLALCPPDEIDTIVIAGLGGDTIVKILDEAEWCMDSRYTLILQPMTKAEVVRYWLVYNEFEICCEELADDAGTLYQILIARFGGETKLTDAELFAGKASLASDRTLYRRHLDQLRTQFDQAIRGMEKGESANSPRARLYREILGQFDEMREET